ncbi:MAG: Do family serine endopeptidase [Planctomycetia bacterium]|nr:Do family serine endopeptidase [Planctomycetia bacterium]
MTLHQFTKRRSLLGTGILTLAVASGGLLWREAHTVAQGPAIVPNTPANAEAKSHANGLSHAFRSAATTILPTVVTIETSTKAKVVRSDGRRPNMGPLNPRGGAGGENPFKGTPFEEFFNQHGMEGFRGGDGPQRSPRSDGAGSGVIIDKSGVILTNNHVVRGADVVTVRLADGREFKGVDIKTDPQTDLAIVRIEGAEDLKAAKLGDSDSLEIGDWVIAVGNPFGLEQTVSAGIISGKGRSIGAAQRANFLQTDAAINPGNSGGPLVNLDGEIIGINTAIASNGGGNDGIGFAVPSSLAKWIVPQLMSKSGAVERAYLGVGIEQMNSELAGKFGVQRGTGVLITEVHPNTPAADAGLKEGDIILDYNGVKVHTPRELQEVVERTVLNTKQKANVLRDGKSIVVEVTARALPKDFGRTARLDPAEEPGPSKNESVASKELGVEVAKMGADEAKQLGFEGYKGVLITNVDPESLAQEAGLREGMLIRKVGQQDVTSPEEFQAAVEKQPVADGVLLLVRTANGNRYVVLKNK